MNLPVVISLQYENNFLKFQVNPEKLKKDIPSESNTVDIEGIGQIGIPTYPKLATITISSFFWQDKNILPSALYVSWLEKWQKSKKPAKLIVTMLNYSMYVTCEHFWHERRAGEESDIYYELSLQEYRPYGAKFVNVQNPVDYFEKLINANLDVPILIDIPRPQRTNNKAKIENPYVVENNETLVLIARAITGKSEDWKKIYENNKEKLGNFISGDEEIPAGTEINVPEELL